MPPAEKEEIGPMAEKEKASGARKRSMGPPGRGVGRKRSPLMIALGLALVLGSGYLYFRHEAAWLASVQKTALQRTEATSRGSSLAFEAFVLPVERGQKFTYLFLSISFPLPNRELEGEMREKRHLLRGRIYDGLREAIQGSGPMPSLEALKGLILRITNDSLQRGRLKEVYVTEFLAI